MGGFAAEFLSLGSLGVALLPEVQLVSALLSTSRPPSKIMWELHLTSSFTTRSDLRLPATPAPAVGG
jgi:hypothetical protein